MEMKKIGKWIMFAVMMAVALFFVGTMEIDAAGEPLIKLDRGLSPATNSSSMKICDEDTLASDSDDCIATQGNVKTYFDSGSVTLTNKTLISGTLVGGTVSSGTFTVVEDISVTEDATGGNAGARATIEGLFQLGTVSFGTGTNGTTETAVLVGSTPSETWAALETGAPDVTVTDNSTVYRAGSSSLKVVYGATAGVGDGITANLTDDNWTANESVGGWIRSSTVLSAGDLILGCYDASTVKTVDVPAVATADKWTWVELSIAAGDCDMDTVRIVAGTTAIISQTIYFDAWYKWDADDEESIGANLVQDGVLGIVAVATAAGSANTTSDLALYTDYFVHYQSGNDAVVWISDQSGNSSFAIYAWQ